MPRHSLAARRAAATLASALVAATFAALGQAGHAEARRPGPADMIADLNTTGAGIGVVRIVDTADGVFFAGETTEHGIELYYHDEPSGTTTLLEIYPGVESAYPDNMLLAPDGTLLFRAYDPEHGRELWRSDGTPDGTRLVKDILPGPEEGNPYGFVVANNTVYFAADDGTNADDYGTGAELWTTDGTAAGTHMVTTSVPLTYVSSLTVFPGAMEELLFMSGVQVGTPDIELWRYTPSSDQAEKYDLLPGNGASSPNSIAASTDRVWMSAFTGAGDVLVRLDDPDGAIGFVAVPAVKNPHDFVPLEGVDGVWMRARRTAPPNEFGLWLAVGPGAPTEFVTAPDPSSIALHETGAALFAGTDADGNELWAASLGANQIADVVPGPDSSRPAHILHPPGQTHVVVWVQRDALTSLVRVDLDDGDVHEFPGLDPLGINDGTTDFEPDGDGGWWHPGRDATTGPGLWRMDATGTVTTPVPGTDVPDGTDDSNPQPFIPFGDGVAFAAVDGLTGMIPWRFDRGSGSAAALTAANPADRPSYVQAMTVSGAQLFANSYHAASGAMSLFVSDGEPGGTRRVSDTAGTPTFVTSWGDMAALNGGVVFGGETIDGNANSDTEPWFSDGTMAGTYRIADIAAGPFGSFPTILATVGDVVLFSAQGDLWATDGSPGNAVKLADFDAYPSDAVVVATPGGDVAYVTTGLAGLWRTDGTVTGTKRVTVNADPNLDPPFSRLMAAGTRVYVQAESAELWTIDTASNDTVAKVPTGDVRFDIMRAAPAGDALVTAGGTGPYSNLATSTYAIRGTTVVDLGVLPGDFNFDQPFWGAGDGDTVYFVGKDAAHGREIWRTDGTPAGTQLAIEVVPGPADVDPRQLTVVGDRLYFSGYTAEHGREPYSAPLHAAIIVPVEPARYWDTRAGEQTFDHAHEATGRLAARTPYRLQIAGRGGIPEGAQAVAANIAVILPDGAGWATLYPCTTEVPKASHLNYVAGNVLANAAVVPLDGEGDVCIYSTQAADFILDVNGFVDPGASALGIEPARYLDTRPGDEHNTFDGESHGSAPVDAESFVKVRIAGRGAVPANATAAIVNVTGVTPADHGYLTLWSCTDPRPTASTVNYTPGDIVPNGAVIELSDDGSICIFTKAASHIVLDVTGYLTEAATSIHTMSPARLHDSRAGNPIVDGTSAGPRLAPEQAIEIHVTGRAGVPVGAYAAFLNVAAIGTDGHGYVTLWPCDDPSSPRPLASNVNYTPGMTRANNALVKLSPHGTVCAFTKAGADLILDVTGWID